MFESWLKNTSAHFGEIETGYKRGERDGEQKGRMEVAKELLALGIDLEVIAQATKVSHSDLKQLSQHHSDA